jgi:hypothetical protein
LTCDDYYRQHSAESDLAFFVERTWNESVPRVLPPRNPYDLVWQVTDTGGHRCACSAVRTPR